MWNNHSHRHLWFPAVFTPPFITFFKYNFGENIFSPPFITFFTRIFTPVGKSLHEQRSHRSHLFPPLSWTQRLIGTGLLLELLLSHPLAWSSQTNWYDVITCWLIGAARQINTCLHQGCPKLKRNTDEGQNDVREGKVGDVEVGDGLEQGDSLV